MVAAMVVLAVPMVPVVEVVVVTEMVQKFNYKKRRKFKYLSCRRKQFLVNAIWMVGGARLNRDTNKKHPFWSHCAL